MPSPSAASTQLRYLTADARRVAGGRWWRWIGSLVSPSFLSVVGYRASRAAYLALGPSWSAVRILLTPFRVLLRPFGAGLEIHYRADIGPGILVLHPNLGVVVSGATRAGAGLTLTGGNCIGTRRGMKPGELVLGDHVNLGVNAVILGPALIGDRVVVGAGSVVLGDAPAGSVMVGSPARPSGVARESG